MGNAGGGPAGWASVAPADSSESSEAEGAIVEIWPGDGAEGEAVAVHADEAGRWGSAGRADGAAVVEVWRGEEGSWRGEDGGGNLCTRMVTPAGW